MKKKAGTVIPPERRSPRLQKNIKLSTIDLTGEIDCSENNKEDLSEPIMPIPDVVIPTLPSTVQTLPQLREAFLSRLKGQDTTLNKLSNINYEFNAKCLEQGKSAPMILPLLLTGISGTGKTTSIDILCSLYGMARDSETFVYRDLSDIVKEEDLTKLLGGAPSYLGYGEKNFIDDLLFAIGNRGIITTQKTTTVTTTSAKGRPPKNLKRSKFVITPDKKPAPPVIIVHFEELDKAHPSLLTVLINFLETGKLTSGNRKEFALPSETKMILVFTANYGLHEIADYSYLTDYHKAKNAVTEDMLDRGIEKPLIGRFPHILPYFPLEATVMKEIATESISMLFEEVEFQYRDYFRKFSCKQESEYILGEAISTYTNRVDPLLGMRSLTAICQELKRELCCETMIYITDFLMPSEEIPLSESPLLDVLLFSPLLIEECDYKEILGRCHTKTTTYHLIEKAWQNKTNLLLLVVKYKDQIMTSIVIKSEVNTEVIQSNTIVITNDNSTRKYCVICGHCSKNYQRMRCQEMVGSKIRMTFKVYCNLCIYTHTLAPVNTPTRSLLM